jgi:hypothetical protein
MTIVLVIVVILLALGVLGTVIEGLLWLTFIALVLVAAAVVYGWYRFKRRT